MPDAHPLDDPLRQSTAAPPTSYRERYRTRGHVRSFETGRTCGSPDCETVLSRYNDSGSCSIHDRKTSRPG